MSTYLPSARKVFEIEISALVRLSSALGASFDQTVEAIRECVERRNKVVVVGVGKCSHIGDKIAATLTSTGTLAYSLNSMNALHGDLGAIRDGDVVLALSNSGETAEIVDLLMALRGFDATRVAITGNPESTLARHSDVVINVAVEREACPLNLAPTASSTAMLVLGDALAMVLMEAGGFGQKEFARVHPGGNLGRKLTLTAKDMMRPLEKIALVNEATEILAVLEAMTERHAGAAVVVGKDASLAGVFTHGDFVRAFQSKGSSIINQPVRELMTEAPVTVPLEMFALEVLEVLEEHRIDDVVVVGESGAPVGVIDVQDLTRLKIV